MALNLLEQHMLCTMYIYPLKKSVDSFFFSDMKNVDGSTEGLDCLWDLLAKVNTSQYCNQITYLWWSKVTNLIFSHTEKKQKVHQEIARAFFSVGMKTHVGQMGLMGFFGLVLPVLALGIHHPEKQFRMRL